MLLKAIASVALLLGGLLPEVCFAQASMEFAELPWPEVRELAAACDESWSRNDLPAERSATARLLTVIREKRGDENVHVAVCRARLRSVEQVLSLNPEQQAVVTAAKNNILSASAAYSAGRSEEGIRQLLAARETITKTLGESDYMIPLIERDLADGYHSLSQPERVIGHYTTCITLKRRFQHPDAARFECINLAALLSQSGRHEAALKIATENLASIERCSGRESFTYAFGLAALADVHLAQQRYDEALQANAEAVKIFAASSNGKYYLPLTLSLRGQLLEKLGRQEEALTAFRNALTAHRAALRDKSQYEQRATVATADWNFSISMLQGIERVALKLGRLEEAETARAELATETGEFPAAAAE